MTASRIQPDSRPVLIVATVITSLLAAVSFLLSFNGLAEAASWANIPAWLAWALPAYVDGAILVYTVAALVFRSRGDSARLEWAALALFAALSVAANGVHAWTAAPEGFRVALGVTLAALAPVSVLLTTHTIAKLIVAPPTVAEELPRGQRATYAVMDETEGWTGHRAAVLEHPDAHTWDAKADEGKAWTDEDLDHVPAPPIPTFIGPALARPAELPTLTVAEMHTRSSARNAQTAERNARIRELAADGKSLRAIAAEVGCSKSNVARVLGKRPDDDTDDALPAEADAAA